MSSARWSSPRRLLAATIGVVILAGAGGGAFLAGRSVERRRVERAIDESHPLEVSGSGPLIHDGALLEEVRRQWLDSGSPPDPGGVTAEWAGRIDGHRAVLLSGYRRHARRPDLLAATFVEDDDHEWSMSLGPRGMLDGPVAVGPGVESGAGALHLLIPPKVDAVDVYYERDGLQHEELEVTDGLVERPGYHADDECNALLLVLDGQPWLDLRDELADQLAPIQVLSGLDVDDLARVLTAPSACSSVDHGALGRAAFQGAPESGRVLVSDTSQVQVAGAPPGSLLDISWNSAIDDIAVWLPHGDAPARWGRSTPVSDVWQVQLPGVGNVILLTTYRATTIDDPRRLLAQADRFLGDAPEPWGRWLVVGAEGPPTTVHDGDLPIPIPSLA
jgi:hypothetical protein